MLKGYMGQILDVDLCTGKISYLPLDENEAALYIGGKGLGTKILYDNTKQGIDPLSKDNVLIFSTGPLTGSYALNSVRFNVNAKSPLTGGCGSSSCGGDFALKLKQAGFDAVVVRGKAVKPCRIVIEDGKAEILDASELWGLGTTDTQEKLGKTYGHVVIGPAGENLVLFASIVSEERVSGRTGMGAVMGSKNLKAISAKGKKRIEIAEEDAFKEYRKKMTQAFAAHPMTGDVMKRLGTANLVMVTNSHNILPTRNYSSGTFEGALNISGEELAEKYLVKNGGCTGCPIQCGRVVSYNGKKIKGPEFETLGELGSNIGNSSMEKIIELNYICDDLGMDTISCGGVLAFAMELNKKGLLKSNLSFGKIENLVDVIRDIAFRRGLGDELANGVRRLSEKYGGMEYAIHVKGLELPAYDPRGCYGQALEYATTNRGGCHIQGATMYMEATGPLNIDPHSVKVKPELVFMQQNMAAAIASLVMCMFSSYALIPSFIFNLKPHGIAYRAIISILLNAGPVLRFSFKNPSKFRLFWYEKFMTQVTGTKVTMGDFMTAGERIFNLERLYNIREGFSARDDRLPERLLRESIFRGIQGGVPLDKMLPKYYKVRGWSKEGIPLDSTLRRLKIT